MPSLPNSPTSTEPPSAADDAVVASFRIFHQHCPRREGFNSPAFMPDVGKPDGQYVGLACEGNRSKSRRRAEKLRSSRESTPSRLRLRGLGCRVCDERVYVVLLPLT